MPVTAAVLCIAADFERRAIQAAALGQQATGCPVNFHPGRHPSAPAEVLRVFQEAGGDVTNCIMSHMDSERALICSLVDTDIDIGNRHSIALAT